MVIIIGIVCALPLMIKFGKRPLMAIGFTIGAFGWFMPQISLNKTFVTIAAAIVGFGFECTDG